jgi:hypothetical protein
VIRVLVLDVPAARQPAVDRALCRALAQPFQDLIDAVVAVWSALPPEQFVVDPADMPLSALQATFASHLQLRDKWQDRRGDQRAEAAAIQQLYEETRLQCCQFWIQRNLADADLLERALLELENTIVTLGTVLDERQRRSG